MSKTVISDSLYNGKCKLIVQNRNFMLEKDVLECMNELNNKKCEGFDRIPVCVLAAAKPILLKNLTELFQKIYVTCKLPEQWKVTKIVPTFKKGNKVDIENYRPIANLCSTSKIFEKLILKQNNIHDMKELVLVPRVSRVSDLNFYFE